MKEACSAAGRARLKTGSPSRTATGNRRCVAPAKLAGIWMTCVGFPRTRGAASSRTPSAVETRGGRPRLETTQDPCSGGHDYEKTEGTDSQMTTREDHENNVWRSPYEC